MASSGTAATAVQHLPFDLAAVEAAIAETRFAGTLQYLESTASTNSLALAARRAGATAGVWVAGEQTAGRGRGGHSWHSAAGAGLYCSALVTGQFRPASLQALPLAAGLAVRAAVRQVAGIALDLRWPNDLMAGERKCGGILVESASSPTASASGPPDVAPAFAVIGIGLNLNQREFPPELRTLATSLHLVDGAWHRHERYLGAILRALDRELKALAGDEALGTLHTRFEAASSFARGKRVRVGDGPGGYTGVTAGLDREGFLRVLDDSGEIRTVRSGGVRPEPAPGARA